MKLTRYVCQNCHRSLVFPSRAKFLSVKCPGCGTIVELNPHQPESDPPTATTPPPEPPSPPPEPPAQIDDDAEVELGAEFEFAGRDLADLADVDSALPATEFDLAPEIEIDIGDIDISNLGGTSIDAADIDLADDDLAPTLSDIDFAELNAEPDAEFDFAEPDTDLAADFELEPLDAEIKLPALRDVDLLGDDLLDDDLLESTLPAGHSLPHRGNLGEPYCSDACYEAAGRDIAVANLHAYSGPCGFCEQPVTLGTGSGNFAHPFQKLLLYICPDCRARGETHARNLQECCFCGRHL